MASLIEMEENQVICMGGGGSSIAITANMTRLATLEAAGTTLPTRPIVRLDALAIVALTLLAF